LRELAGARAARENGCGLLTPDLTAKSMDLEQFHVVSIDSPLTLEKRRAIEAQIDENAKALEREVSYKWLKRGEERFLRILFDPVTVEVVFFEDRIECFVAAPAWSRVLLTKARKAELKTQLEQVLVGAGFVIKAGD